MENLDKVTTVMNAIVDQDRGMDQLADTDPSLDWAANVREGSQFDMVQRARKPFRSHRKD